MTTSSPRPGGRWLRRTATTTLVSSELSKLYALPDLVDPPLLSEIVCELAAGHDA
ncbi:hypothetical protein ACWT_0199 [Actinoplanes sp. SE50]|uniref:hypothetical protein n=1 Tax=unclassified Actinoplanes TaxID=2626549 RepID=UPI00023ED6F5|nr:MULTISPECIES: hypothetical protein [unclassified Actinoplanes]AEV81211.1 hypothetical protein ACPL_314 [Actinoplanes sp. SE50/110]ATO79614.1 hypothetical protein ACWT_0199 [Actinoplanes sp. SE50]SLL97017.1 hypothetical protein ACSP50_0213 [Actinoplanes sp. SE50/110]